MEHDSLVTLLVALIPALLGFARFLVDRHDDLKAQERKRREELEMARQHEADHGRHHVRRKGASNS